MLNVLCDARAMANTGWLYIRDASCSQGICICTLVVNKGAAYIDRHSEEPIMKALLRIYDSIAGESHCCIARRAFAPWGAMLGSLCLVGCACM